MYQAYPVDAPTARTHRTHYMHLMYPLPDPPYGSERLLRRHLESLNKHTANTYFESTAGITGIHTPYPHIILIYTINIHIP